MADALRDNGTRQDTWAIRVYLNGQDFGIWDKKTGGEVDSESNLYYPGNMLDPVDLGGRVTTGNVTLQRLYDRDDDHPKINTLINQAGRGGIKIGIRPKDIDGNGYGAVVTYLGRLKRVSMPDIDSESQTAALVEIEITISGVPQAA